MAKTLQELLGWETLTGLVRETEDGLPDVLPKGFETTNMQKVLGDAGTYTVVRGNRRVPRQVMYGAPAVRRELAGIATRAVKLLHTFEELSIAPLTFQALRNYTDYNVQRRGQDELARQLGFFQFYFKNYRRATTLLALAKQTLWFDSKGNLLPSSSGSDSTRTISFQVSATNQNQLTDSTLEPNNPTIITQTWASPATDIPLQVRRLRKRARRKTGQRLKYALYGENVPSYLAQNALVKDWFVRHPEKRAEYLDSGELPSGLLGLDWVPAYEAFYEDFNGVNQDVWSPDLVVFTPEPNGDWWDVLEGSYQVPSSINIMAGGEEAWGALQTVYGRFGYAHLNHNPPGCLVYAGDTFLPVFTNPDAAFFAAVTP